MTSPSKVRILCLHGMVQNGHIFYKKTAVIRKKLHNVAELVYVTAPHLIVDPKYTSEAMREAAGDNDAPEEQKPFGWWKPDGQYTGFQESIDDVKKVLAEEGPFDGIFGFSQGACLAAVITYLLEHGSLLSSGCQHPPFRFALMAAGFKPAQPSTYALFEEKVKTPSLHMIGEQDSLIVPERMRSLAEAFDTPEFLEHSGGHVVPSNAASRHQIAAFVDKFIPSVSL